jgi:hypothetical protein
LGWTIATRRVGAAARPRATCQARSAPSAISPAARAAAIRTARGGRRPAVHARSASTTIPPTSTRSAVTAGGPPSSATWVSGQAGTTAMPRYHGKTNGITASARARAKGAATSGETARAPSVEVAKAASANTEAW